MRKAAQKRNDICGFLTIVIVSSATMLWLFWHHPVKTAIVTVIVLSALGLSARLARCFDNDEWSDVGRGNQGA